MPARTETDPCLHDAELRVVRSPSHGWCWEPAAGFVLEVHNRDFAPLADPALCGRLRCTADLYQEDGTRVRRIAFEALPGPVARGDVLRLETALPMMALPGAYEVAFGLEEVLPSGEEHPLAARVRGTAAPIRLDLTIREAFVELVSVCNFACTFCPQPEVKRAQKVMDFDLACKVVRDLADMGHHYPIRVHLLGEPLLYPRFTDFVDHAHSVGQCISLTTNGSRFDPATVHELFRPGLAEIMVSLNTPGEELFDAQRGTSMTYAAYMESVRVLVREAARRGAPPRTMIQVLYDERSDPAAALAQANEVAHYWADFVHSTRGSSGELPVLERFDPSKLTIVDLLPGLELQFSPYHAWGEGPQPGQHFCTFPMRQLAILSDGQATACCVDARGEIHLGDARTQSVAEIWNGAPLQRIRRGFWNDMRAVEPRCQRCDISHLDLAQQFRGDGQRLD